MNQLHQGNVFQFSTEEAGDDVPGSSNMMLTISQQSSFYTLTTDGEESITPLNLLADIVASGSVKCMTDCGSGGTIKSGTWLSLERVHFENCLDIQCKPEKNYFVVETNVGERYSISCLKFLVDADPPVIIVNSNIATVFQNRMLEEDGRQFLLISNLFEYTV